MPTLLLLCLLGLLSCLATGSASEYLYHVCPNTTTFNPNSSYETNLNFVISSLSSNATRDTGFYNVTAGRTPPDVAYGLFLCRGDVTSQVCQDCVATAVNETVRRRCRGFKQAIIWYDECMLRYSNESFFSQVSERPRVAMYNTQNSTGVPDQFFQVLVDTLKSFVTTQGVNDQSGKKFATREENISGLERVYSLVQCTPDLSPQQCDLQSSMIAAMTNRGQVSCFQAATFGMSCTHSTGLWPHHHLLRRLDLQNQALKVNSLCVILGQAYMV